MCLGEPDSLGGSRSPGQSPPLAAAWGIPAGTQRQEEDLRWGGGGGCRWGGFISATEAQGAWLPSPLPEGTGRGSEPSRPR